LDPINPPAPQTDATPAPANGSPAEAAVTQSGWVARNAVTLIMILLAVAASVYYLRRQEEPIQTLQAIVMMAIGFGLVIFVHELGHFLAAKWCDVHVQTFSIGFGPALLGLCSFKRGETTYKIAWFPLGGYVKMLGEGDNGEEAEEDPRSYKNKSVWKRMVIISAGVVMNLLMAMICFIGVYMTRGVNETPAIVGHTEPGGPAWKKGIPTGSRIEQIGDRASPYYEELQRVVFNSRKGQPLPLIYDSFSDGKPARHEIEITPARNESIPLPMIGIKSANVPVLVTKGRGLKSPYLSNSPAANAKPALELGDRVVAATDPDHPEEITPLTPDPRRPGAGERDYFDLRRRLERLIGKPITLRIEKSNGSTEDVVIPAAFAPSIGLRMRMGEVVAIRENSPAAKAGLIAKDGSTPGDIITAVSVTGADSKTRITYSATPGSGELPLDPLRLPVQLAQWAQTKPPDRTVHIRVLRPEGHKGQEPKDLEMSWDPNWELFDDLPSLPQTPLTLASLGIAYRVKAVVEGIDPGGPAEGLSIAPGDTITEIEYVAESAKGKNSSERRKLKEDQWAYYGTFLQHDLELRMKEVVLTKGTGEKVSITPREDPSWPMLSRGLLFEPDIRVHKANGFVDALALGFRRVLIKTATIYENLYSLVTLQLSPEAMSGPLGIGRAAFIIASQDDYEFILFLALININLAVVNFLPIPLLDGGHMVFLLYELIRGKPPSETVRFVLSILGLTIIAALFLFAFYLDIRRIFF
jgi:regulator of sigma E protease